MDCLVSQPNANLYMVPLISGLPDDLALFCLARVPRKYHGVLKCVSRRWRDLLHSEDWCAFRREHHLDETWIYALWRDNKLERVGCYVLNPDSTKRSWKMIRELPTRTLRRTGMGFEVLGHTAFLLGGCGWSEDATKEVYCYDASRNSWTEAAPLSTARAYFASGVLNQEIYCIGGLGDTHSWDVYDPYTNNWKLHSEPNMFTEIKDSFVMDGKIYICCSTSAPISHICALVYDPSTGYWQHEEPDMASGWQGPAVVVDDTLYVLDQSSGTKLMRWQKESREWAPVGRLSPLLTRPPCQLVAIGKTIFIIGKGCSAVVINIGNIGKVEGVMMSSSIPKLDDDVDIISCKCLAI